MTQTRPGSRDSRYFEALYAANEDPWNFRGSAYEHQKYAATLAMLQGRHFASGLEIGCSIGVLTKMLAPSCARLLAVDMVEQPLALARARCADAPHVSFARMRVPAAWPPGCFDLIVLSEVLYFLEPADITRAAALAQESLLPGGALLLVNYTEAIDEPCNGDEAAGIFMRCTAQTMQPVRQMKTTCFRIDVLQKH